MSVRGDVGALVGTLGELDEHCLVLVAAAKALAAEIDVPNEKKSAAAAVRELRSTLGELMERCRVGDNDDEAWDFDGPGAPTVRNGAGPESSDVRPRGRRDRKASRETVDAVAAVRR